LRQAPITALNAFDADTSFMDVRGMKSPFVHLSRNDWLPEADYARFGPDLVISNDAGEKIVLVGYFENSVDMAVKGANGVIIPAHIVDILAGPEAPMQFAQAGGGALGEPIGQIDTLSGTVTVVRASGEKVTLKQGDPVYQGDELVTGGDGAVGVTFADESTMSLDADGRLVLDELVYDAASAEGGGSMMLLQGAMTFVSGQIAKTNPDAMNIKTPVATIGIRGTAGGVVAGEGGETSVVLLSEAGQDGGIQTGEITVATSGGVVTVNGGFQGLSITDGTQAPPTPQTMSLNEVGRVFGNSIANMPNSNALPQSVTSAVEKVVAREQAAQKAQEAQDNAEEAQQAADQAAQEAANAPPEEKAEAEQKAAEAQAEAERAQAEAQDAETELNNATQEADQAVNDAANTLGDGNLAGDTNLTAEVVPPSGPPAEQDQGAEDANNGEGGEQEAGPNQDAAAPEGEGGEPEGPGEQGPAEGDAGQEGEPVGDGPEDGPVTQDQPLPPPPTGTVAGGGPGDTNILGGGDGDFLTESGLTGGDGLDGGGDGDLINNPPPPTTDTTTVDTPPPPPPNKPPIVANAIANQTGEEGTAFNLTLPLDAFGDPDGDKLTYSATFADGSSLDTQGITFDPTTRTFSGTPANGSAGTHSIKVTVTDGRGGSVSDTFDFTISENYAETQVNTETVGDQTTATVAALSDGGWVVTWQSIGHDNADLGWGVYAQMYNADGSERGSEFLVNTTTAGAQWVPEAVGLTDGDFLIAWTGYSQPGDVYSGIYAQRYSADGTPDAGGEMHLNTSTTGDEADVQLLPLAGGGYAAVIRHEGASSVNYSDVYLQIFDGSDTEILSETLVNTYTNQHQSFADVVGTSDGKLFTVWSSMTQDTGSSTGIYGKIYDPSGPSWGSEFQINDASSQDQQYPSAAALSNGNVAVVWTDWDTNSLGINGKIFDSSGAEVVGQFSVNSTMSIVQGYPSVTALSGGNFAVVWEGQGDDSGSTTEYGIFGQIFNSSGGKVGSEFVVNTTTAGEQLDPQVATLADGDFLVTWESDGQDGDGLGIYMQRFNADGTTNGTAITVNDAPTLYGDYATPSFGAGQSIGAAENYHYVETGDFNNDGNLDLALAGGTASDVTIRLGDGAGGFGAEYTVVSGAYGRLRVADLNGDNYDDIVTGAGDVYLNNQDNSFTSSFTFGAINRQTSLGDADGDGDLDLLVLNQSTAPKLYLNDGSGGFTLGQTFTQQQAFFNDTASAFADFDGDGDKDIVIGGWGQDAEVWENDGTGTYTFNGYLNNKYDSGGGTDTGTGSTLDIETGDFDGDGDIDLYLNNRYSQSYVFKNDGDGNLTFTKDAGYGGTDAGPLAGTNGRENSAIGDLDSDGDLDIVSAHWDGADEYLINDGTGTFTNINSTNAITTYTNDTYQSAIGDFNGDGLDDVFKAGYTADHSEVILNTSNEVDYCYLTDVAVSPFSSMDIADGDSTNIASANLTITGFAAGDVLSVGTPGSLSVNYNTSTGVMNITGVDTIANYQTAIQSITFTSATDATESRTISLTVSDESGGTSDPLTAKVNLVNTDPIVVDLDGDGIETVSASEGVTFDIDGDGVKEQTGWVAPDDGLLAADLNGNGSIDNVDELMSPSFNYENVNPGDLTSSADVLALYDENKDGMISSEDEIYDKLVIWQDVNSNGISEAGELTSLQDAGIESLNLSYTKAGQSQDGNTLTKLGETFNADGSSGQWGEVVFGNADSYTVAPSQDEENGITVAAE